MLEDKRARATQAVTANVGQFNVILDEEAPADPNAPRNQVQSGPLSEPAVGGAGVDDVPLQPGDLITYYAEGSDRGQTGGRRRRRSGLRCGRRRPRGGGCS